MVPGTGLSSEALAKEGAGHRSFGENYFVVTKSKEETRNVPPFFSPLKEAAVPLGGNRRSHGALFSSTRQVAFFVKMTSSCAGPVTSSYARYQPSWFIPAAPFAKWPQDHGGEQSFFVATTADFDTRFFQEPRKKSKPPVSRSDTAAMPRMIFFIGRGTRGSGLGIRILDLGGRIPTPKSQILFSPSHTLPTQPLPIVISHYAALRVSR